MSITQERVKHKTTTQIDSKHNVKNVFFYYH